VNNTPKAFIHHAIAVLAHVTMPRMKIKICYTNSHGADGGGHTTYILSLARALGTGHEISVIAPDTSRLYQEAGQIPYVRRHTLRFRTRLLSMLRDALRMRAILRHERYDIVHVNLSSDHRCVMLASLGLGRKRPRIVFTKHNSLAASSFGNTLRALLATSRVICVSDSTRTQLEHTAYRRCGLHVVRNGVDLAHYAPWNADAAAQARRHWLGDLPRGTLVVGSNAGVAPYKCWLDMVRAVASLPPAMRLRVFVMLAGQPFQDNERAEIKSLGMSGQVIHAGFLHDVRPFIAALDLGFVLSSRVETISFACREMMAMGKPVIVSNAGGLPENISPGQDGWVVPQQAPAAVAAVLRTVLDDPGGLTAMSQAARAKSEAEFGLERFTRETLRVYQDTLPLHTAG
jgi:glycosyltransferase involved in cell wall biosynthesis